ncbi:hypothetical protein COLO4_37514 [Corchorus olitorius]|uniref:Uncharacterized protein n=1 Tax=Corchorus olitorius TaxID=93759 RepID=A0A1R3G139_9ROSI|nr:hypothetical protein COLO4_37514 [Corchorus olitorius]
MKPSLEDKIEASLEEAKVCGDLKAEGKVGQVPKTDVKIKE